MVERTPIIERAFQLAQSGECHAIPELNARLRKEQYSQVDEHLSGKSIKQQLRDIFTRAPASR